MTGPVLSVRNLTTSFRVEGVWQSVVRNLDFTIDKGETVAIVGESGSGKSVTALSIMQLLQTGIGRSGPMPPQHVKTCCERTYEIRSQIGRFPRIARKADRLGHMRAIDGLTTGAGTARIPLFRPPGRRGRSTVPW